MASARPARASQGMQSGASRGRPKRGKPRLAGSLSGCAVSWAGRAASLPLPARDLLGDHARADVMACALARYV
jgi:hypothetical protein